MENKKRIAVIVRSLKFGGMERAACNMADAFATAGHETHLIYFRDKNKEISPRNNDVLLHHFDLQKLARVTIIGWLIELFGRVVNLFVNKSFFLVNALALYPVYLFKLKQLERQYGKFDLILLRGQGTFELIWPAKKSNTARICVNVPNYQQKNIFGNLLARCLFDKSRVVLISQGIMADYERYFSETGVKPTSMDVVNNVFSASAIDKLKNQTDLDIPQEKYIVSVGRLVPVKNNNLLLDAYVILMKKYGVAHHLYFVGDGSDKAQLQKKVEQYGLLERVHFVGYKANPYPWLSRTSLFVLSSKSEGLGGVLLEVLSCRAPMVVTNSKGGVHDIMSRGLQNYICEFNAEDMADKMFLALNEKPDLVQYKKILDDYTPDVVVSRWLKLLNI